MTSSYPQYNPDKPIGVVVEFYINNGGFSAEGDGVWNTVEAGVYDGHNTLYGYYVTATVKERWLDPAWTPDPALGDDQLHGTLERTIDHTPVYMRITTGDTALIDPGIVLYDSGYDEPAKCGIQDGSVYIYPLLFPCDFRYLPAFSGTNFDGTWTGEKSVQDTGWFPTTPYDPNADPPVYPMDTITSFVPVIESSRRITYAVEFKAAFNETVAGYPDGIEGNLTVIQDVVTPTANWNVLFDELLGLCYFTHGIYH